MSAEADKIDYRELLIQLEERLSSDGDDHVRSVARSEIRSYVARWGGLILWVWICNWIHNTFAVSYWIAVPAAVAPFLCWAWLKSQLDPTEDVHLVVSKAEDIARCEIINDISRAGRPLWTITTPDKHNPDITVTFTDDDEWGSFYQRAYAIANDLKKRMPRTRDHRHLRAAWSVEAALRSGAEFAKERGVALSWWPRQVLSDLETAKR